MNSNPSPSDDELDQLLASKLQRTSPEFEQRWRELRGSLTESRTTRRAARGRWWLWPGLATAAVAGLAVLFVVGTPSTPAPPTDGVNFEELIALDAALAPATVLLEPETRDALLHLPADAAL